MKVSSVPSKSNGGNFHAKQRQEVLYPCRRDPKFTGHTTSPSGTPAIMPRRTTSAAAPRPSFGSVTVFAPAARSTLPVRRFPSTRLSAARKTSLPLATRWPTDAPSAESILMDKELLDTLYDELNRLDPDGRRICELIMQGKTEREIAADMGKRQSTINYQKNKVFSILREALKDFI